MGLLHLVYGETEAQDQDCLSQGYTASEWQGWEANPCGFIHSVTIVTGPLLCAGQYVTHGEHTGILGQVPRKGGPSQDAYVHAG